MLFNDVGVLVRSVLDLLVVVVAIEQGLDGVAPQEEGVLAHLLFVVVLPVAVGVLGVEVVFLRGHEGGLDPPVQQVVPLVVFKPDVALDFLGAVEAESVDGLALDELVDKVSSFQAPAGRHLVAPDLHLLGEDVVSDFLAVFTYIGTFPVHALVADDARSEVVYCHAVVLPTHHFGG